MLAKNVAVKHATNGKIANENSGTDGVRIVKGSEPVYSAGKYCSLLEMFEGPMKLPMA